MIRSSSPEMLDGLADIVACALERRLTLPAYVAYAPSSPQDTDPRSCACDAGRLHSHAIAVHPNGGAEVPAPASPFRPPMPVVAPGAKQRSPLTRMANDAELEVLLDRADWR